MRGKSSLSRFGFGAPRRRDGNRPKRSPNPGGLPAATHTREVMRELSKLDAPAKRWRAKARLISPARGGHLGVTAAETGRTAPRRLEGPRGFSRAAKGRDPASLGGRVSRHPVDVQARRSRKRPVEHRGPAADPQRSQSHLVPATGRADAPVDVSLTVARSLPFRTLRERWK